MRWPAIEYTTLCDCGHRNEYVNSTRIVYLKTTSSTDSTTPSDDEFHRLYERFRSTETDEERRGIALETGALDRQRHAETYERLGAE